VSSVGVGCDELSWGELGLELGEELSELGWGWSWWMAELCDDLELELEFHPCMYVGR
jgi:hypothetical protein